MNISREQKDALNAVITIDIVKSDYAENVEKTLNRYRKQPMCLVLEKDTCQWV